MAGTARGTTILMAVPRYPMPIVGGLEKQAHLLAVELVRRGHRVAAVSGRTQSDQPAISVLDGVTVHRVGLGRARWWRWVSWPFMLWLRTHRLIRQADVIHSHVISAFGLYFVLLARLYRKPILVKLPNFGEAGLGAVARGRFGRLRIRVFKLADAVVAMAPESLRELAAIGYPPARVFATPNGIGASAAGGARAPRPNPGCAFVFIGRLDEQKGARDLLAAVARAVADAKAGSFTVDLIGDGEQREAIERQIRELGLGATVRLLGHRDDVLELLPHYDAFVLPSYREGNSNAVLEAMVAGLPVVSTRTGGTPMLVGPTGAQLLHEPGDVTALASLLVRVIESPAWRAEVGAAMRRRVDEHFDIRRVGAGYESAYRLLVDGHRDRITTASDPLVACEV